MGYHMIEVVEVLAAVNDRSKRLADVLRMCIQLPSGVCSPKFLTLMGLLKDAPFGSTSQRRWKL